MSVEAQWTPTAEDIADARITDFAHFVHGRHGVDVEDYPKLWRWSVEHPNAFWAAVWDYFDLAARRPETALADPAMPGARWFPGAKLNYVDQVERSARSDRPAIVSIGEDGTDEEISWPAPMRRRTASLGAHAARAGVGPGTGSPATCRTCPRPSSRSSPPPASARCGPPARRTSAARSVSTASAGRTQSSCSPPTATATAARRTTARDTVAELRARSAHPARRRPRPAARHRRRPTAPWTGRPSPPATPNRSRAGAVRPPAVGAVLLRHHRPAEGASCSRHGGILLEHLKQLGLHCDLRPRRPLLLVHLHRLDDVELPRLRPARPAPPSSATTAAPATPTPDALWQVAARTGATFFGTSPRLRAWPARKAGVAPGARPDLSRAARASAPPARRCRRDGFRWLHDDVGERTSWIASVSGGTDVCSCFVGARPHRCRCTPASSRRRCLGRRPRGLGRARQAAHRRGRRTRRHRPDALACRSASGTTPTAPATATAYFDTYPGVWRHGDWITITARGTVVIHGRSDSTLNRHGVRMGSADIYEAVEKLPEIAESLVIGVEQPDGGYWMPLFVNLADGAELDAALGTASSRDPHPGLAPPRPRRDHRGAGDPAHPHRQEARGPGQAAVPGRRVGPGSGPQRRRRSGVDRLVCRAAARRLSATPDECDEPLRSPSPRVPR